MERRRRGIWGVLALLGTNRRTIAGDVCKTTVDNASVYHYLLCAFIVQRERLFVQETKQEESSDFADRCC